MRDTLLVVLLMTAAALAQTAAKTADDGVFHSAEVGFSFAPPEGMTDVTAKANTSDSKDPNTIQLLLFELSGPNSNDLNWRGLAVQSYARSQVSAGSDFEAEVKLSKTVIGNTATETTAPRKVTINDLTYAVSEYQRTRGMLVEHSRVYATLVHGQLVAFAFSANLSTNLDNMADALKTVRLDPEKNAK